MTIDLFEKTNECPHCKRADLIQIGQKRDGKRFVFYAYRRLRIGSRNDWFRRLGRNHARIVDQDGRDWQWTDFEALTDSCEGDITRPTADGRQWIDSLGYGVRRAE